jgi:phage terminase small subunit
MALTDKQIRFCEEYLIDLNATQAAIRAGYSQRTAGSIGDENLKKPEIKARISAMQAELAERNKVKADDVIQELKALGFWNIKDFVDTGNEIKDLSLLERSILKPVVGIKTKTTFTEQGDREVTVELKLADKRAALVDLGKHLGLFVDKSEVKQEVDIKSVEVKVITSGLPQINSEKDID